LGALGTKGEGSENYSISGIGGGEGEGEGEEERFYGDVSIGVDGVDGFGEYNHFRREKMWRLYD
jgi:hypothetical protein